MGGMALSCRGGSRGTQEGPDQDLLVTHSFVSKTPVTPQAEGRTLWGCPASSLGTEVRFQSHLALGSSAGWAICLPSDRVQRLLSEPQFFHLQNEPPCREVFAGSSGRNTVQTQRTAVTTRCPPVQRPLTAVTGGLGRCHICARPSEAATGSEVPCRGVQGSAWMSWGSALPNPRGPRASTCSPHQCGQRNDPVRLVFHPPNSQPLCARQRAGACPRGAPGPGHISWAWGWRPPNASSFYPPQRDPCPPKMVNNHSLWDKHSLRAGPGQLSTMAFSGPGWSLARGDTSERRLDVWMSE